MLSRQREVLPLPLRDAFKERRVMPLLRHVMLLSTRRPCRHVAASHAATYCAPC